MEKEEFTNALHVGGTLQNALSGDYSLKPTEILKEAIEITQQNFWHFLPAILLFILINVVLFLFSLSFFSNMPKEVIAAYIGRHEMTPELLNDGQIALFVSHILSAPFYAGISLMGLSHALGFKTKVRHLVKGLPFAFAVIISIGLISIIQNIGNQIFPLLGIFLSLTLSMTVLLICEKKINPAEAMIISFRAITKKMLTLLIIYAVIAILFIFAYATAGVALIWALPFMFNVKGVLYREIFGVGIEITVTKSDDDDSSGNNNDRNKEVFNA